MGERSDFFIEVFEEFWSWICSELDGCWGVCCVERGDCFVFMVCCNVVLVRILIINYYLFFLDLVIWKVGIGCDGMVVFLLFQYIIFDEVYNIEWNVIFFFLECYDSLVFGWLLLLFHWIRNGKSRGVLFCLSLFLLVEVVVEFDVGIILFMEISY